MGLFDAPVKVKSDRIPSKNANEELVRIDRTLPRVTDQQAERILDAFYRMVLERYGNKVTTYPEGERRLTTVSLGMKLPVYGSVAYLREEDQTTGDIKVGLRIEATAQQDIRELTDIVDQTIKL